MIDIRALLNILSEAQAPTQAPAKQKPLLLLVHPGSCCGSADFNLGSQLGHAYRVGIARTLAAWNGPILVLDGELSEELADYPEFDSAIEAALSKAEGSHFAAIRVEADALNDGNWVQEAVSAVREIASVGTKIMITGAWTQNDDNGCCDTMWIALKRIGYAAEILPCAVHIDGEGDEEYEDAEDEV